MAKSCGCWRLAARRCKASNIFFVFSSHFSEIEINFHFVPVKSRPIISRSIRSNRFVTRAAMCPKLGLLVVVLLLFQCLEAKKKRPTDSAALSTYVEDLKAVLQDTWDALIELVPAAPQAKHKKKKKDNSWSLNDYVKSATKKFNRFYKSLGAFQLGRTKQPQKDLNSDDVFTVELFAAEVIERATWGFINIVESFGQNDSS
ncbi:hypothetical protein HUJ04_008664 [Dendroctonus ponderosae]|uniref:Uncharacterized protein n=4 Tax=Dendroctonus ponderosae TaxID=77166 RepID=A0AAR5PZB2_DENPD|nr:hypothetical protein HUJ04_008664 [Dendroctonus ponderosae]